MVALINHLLTYLLTLLHRRCADAIYCTRWQHFVVRQDVMATISKVWCQIENPTPLIDAYLLEDHFCEISPHPCPIWNDRALCFFVKQHHGCHLENMTTSEIQLRLLMHISLGNNRAEFHPDPIWNNEALGFWKDEALGFWKDEALGVFRPGWRAVAPTRTRWLAIWDQFLV